MGEITCIMLAGHSLSFAHPGHVEGEHPENTLPYTFFVMAESGEGGVFSQLTGTVSVATVDGQSILVFDLYQAGDVLKYQADVELEARQYTVKFDIDPEVSGGNVADPFESVSYIDLAEPLTSQRILGNAEEPIGHFTFGIRPQIVREESTEEIVPSVLRDWFFLILGGIVVAVLAWFFATEKTKR